MQAYSCVRSRVFVGHVSTPVRLVPLIRIQRRHTFQVHHINALKRRTGILRVQRGQDNPEVALGDALQTALRKAVAMVHPTEHAVQSVMQSAVRGSLAAVVAWQTHINAWVSWSWHTSDFHVAMDFASPVMLLSALLLVPCVAANGPAPYSSSLTALQRYQKFECEDYHKNRVQPLPVHALLEMLAQISEELLARGVLLVLLGRWMSERLIEAGVDDMLLGVPLETASRGMGVGLLLIVISSRYYHHYTKAVADSGARMQEKRQAAQLVSLGLRPPNSLIESGAAALALLRSGALEEEHVREQQIAPLFYGLLCTRFVTSQAAMYASFVVTGSLAASFVAGCGLQAVHQACCHIASLGMLGSADNEK